VKVLVTGAKGQLGQDILKQLQNSGWEVIATSREDLDLSLIEHVADRVTEYNADWVVNCAAYTQVDKAEEDVELAFRINRDAVKEIAKGVAKTQGKLLHISTDYVFDGKKSFPYEEGDDTNPLNIYGRSKLEGEDEIKKILPNVIILRTAWVFGEHGNNFVKTILRLAAGKQELRVVNDQIGSPTWTVDIARAISVLIDNDEQGVYHFSSEGVVSWYDVAREVISLAKQLGYEVITETVLPISTDEYPTLAARPAYSVLSTKKIKKNLALEIPGWKNSLYSMMKLYKHNCKTG
jgi:dTDP-4-dehydrorhamnose reductase